MSFSPLIEQLIESLRCLPGVGPKSAQRMALHLLERARPEALVLSETLERAMKGVKNCQQCQIVSELEICGICSNAKRDKSLLCIVETPADVFTIESTAMYGGRYFVLGGHLSPIDGIGPEDIGLDKLEHYVRNEEIKEVILATNPTVEGEATSHYIVTQLHNSEAKISRIAHGVPLGGELEFVDGGTLAHALQSRLPVHY